MLLNGVAVERAECDAVLSSSLFAGSNNSSRLIRYVCEKYFAGVESIPEYDIAVEALGRRADFDPSQDSIVRVEAHRLRKRLHEYYQGEGAHHELRLTLPQGFYVPRFVLASQCEAPPPSDPTPLVSPPPPLEPASRNLKKRLAIYLGAGILVAALIATVGVVIYQRQHRAAIPSTHVSNPAGAASASDVLIMAGSSAEDYTDHLGHVWSHDRFYNGGDPWPVRYRRIRRTDDPQLFLSARQGEDFGYDIPLAPGLYELRLYFAETFYGEDNSEGGGESSRIFDITANSLPLLTDFDPLLDAGGSNTADARVFTGISPALDGKLHLEFKNRYQLKGVAFVNAIQVVRLDGSHMAPIRWITSDSAVIDEKGRLWLPDQFVEGGRRRELREAVGGTSEPELYKAERYGNFTYSIPVAENSTYTMTLYFAEHWFGIPSYGNGSAIGNRVFDVYCNGVWLLKDFDISKEAGGSLRAVTRTFSGLHPNHQGKLVISFVPNKNTPSLSAIEITPESNK